MAEQLNRELVIADGFDATRKGIKGGRLQSGIPLLDCFCVNTSRELPHVRPAATAGFFHFKRLGAQLKQFLTQGNSCPQLGADTAWKAAPDLRNQCV